MRLPNAGVLHRRPPLEAHTARTNTPEGAIIHSQGSQERQNPLDLAVDGRTPFGGARLREAIREYVAEPGQKAFLVGVRGFSREVLEPDDLDSFYEIDRPERVFAIPGL
ncbi:MAG: hypothetical protein ACTHXC_00400 [Brachybacterium sp.]